MDDDHNAVFNDNLIPPLLVFSHTALAMIPVDVVVRQVDSQGQVLEEASHLVLGEVHAELPTNDQLYCEDDCDLAEKEAYEDPKRCP